MLDSTLTLKIPERIKRIDELAHNIWWSWHPRARDVFRSLDYTLWRTSGHNPVKILYEIDEQMLQQAAKDPTFLTLYDSVMTAFDAEMKANDNWFNSQFPHLLKGPVAYFSMEFALHGSLPIYAGGLGILAGDMCKECSDLGVPLVGVGFMYPQGYFHQHISGDGWQQEIYQQLNFQEAPIYQIFTANGSPSIAQVTLVNRQLSIGVWQVNVGKVINYLLDTNVEQNTPEDRLLSARLYTADPEMRIQQEIVLGIGGARVLHELGIEPSIWHANEGHSAFMSLERIRHLVKEGMSYNEALARVQAATIFTTHTPVPSGHDVFAPGLMEKYFANYWQSLGINREEFFRLGSPDIRGQGGFNMTALAINTSTQRNAVSQLHEIETKKMWRAAWPGKPDGQIPISHVTNGVHVPTWIGLEYTRLFEKYLGRDWLKEQDNKALWDKIRDIPDDEIFAIHRSLKSRLMEVIMERAQRRWAEGEVIAQQVVTMGALLNPQVLTIGFARRFTEYKRPALILNDIDRLKKIINNPWRPVQIIFAGKSHPADFSGKYILHKIYSIGQDREFQGRIAFVEDYDMMMARYLVHGVDVWLNNPYRLQEASGTSGMKAAINGIPNLSVRDGWWEEGFDKSNGWAIGDGPEAATSPDQDKNDAQSLYDLLEKEVIPLYYAQDRTGISHGWSKMVKESICSVMPQFCATRMVKDYVIKFYSRVPELMQTGSNSGR